MTAPVWFALAAVLAAAGLMLLALHRRRTPANAPESHTGPQTGPTEGDGSGDLFTPVTPPHRIAQHWQPHKDQP